MEANAIRPFGPSDRKAAAELLGDERPLDLRQSHVHLAADSLALWLEPSSGIDEAYLGPVITPAGPGRRFYELVLACANDALARGYQRGHFKIKDRGLLRLLQRTFRIEPLASGWEPEGGSAREWDVYVDLSDAIEQLRSVITQLGGEVA